MAVLSEGICANGASISFGDYTVKQKLKIDNFEFNGDIYKLKTHNQVTRLEKNDGLFMETVPGAAIHDLVFSPSEIAFYAEGIGDTQVTLSLEPSEKYSLKIDDSIMGEMNTGSSGKFIFSALLSGEKKKIIIDKH